jgi:hypothetical protein
LPKGDSIGTNGSRRPSYSVICGRLVVGLNSGMKTAIHTFKIGQDVFHHSGGLPGGKRTGPYTIVGMVRQSSGTILYRFKNSRGERLAHPDELKLVLSRAKKASE